ncbi:MAG: hypothetical protein JWM47_4517 [Acidimicrobiales bacterium]|nr:hypothetical protein [Acidimicrobiales bacterium]
MADLHPDSSESVNALHIALSEAVDMARAVPPRGMTVTEFALCRTYVTQILDAAFARMDPTRGDSDA